MQTHFPLPAGPADQHHDGSWYTPLGRSLNRARHRDGSLKPDDEFAAAPVVTAAGRELPTAGGVFPDLEVASQLKEEEMQLLRNANESQVAYGAQIQEFAFDLAKKALAEGKVERLPSSTFDELAPGSSRRAWIPTSSGIPSPEPTWIDRRNFTSSIGRTHPPCG